MSRLETFESIGVQRNSSDRVLWRECQARDLVLITGNRNAESADSLQGTVEGEGTAQSFPVITLANPQRVIRDHEYAARTAERLFEYLMRLDSLRGAGRLYVP